MENLLAQYRSQNNLYKRHCQAIGKKVSATKRMLLTPMAFVCASVVFACIACKPDTKDQTPPAPAIPANVTVARVFAGPVAATLEVNGTLQPLRADGGRTGQRRPCCQSAPEGRGSREAGAAPLSAGSEPSPTPQDSRPRTRRPHNALRRSTPRSRALSLGVMLVRFSKQGDMVTAAPPTVMALVADIDLMKLTALIPRSDSPRYASARRRRSRPMCFPGGVSAAGLHWSPLPRRRPPR